MTRLSLGRTDLSRVGLSEISRGWVIISMRWWSKYYVKIALSSLYQSSVVWSAKGRQHLLPKTNFAFVSLKFNLLSVRFTDRRLQDEWHHETDVWHGMQVNAWDLTCLVATTLWCLSQACTMSWRALRDETSKICYRVNSALHFS